MSDEVSVNNTTTEDTAKVSISKQVEILIDNSNAKVVEKVVDSLVSVEIDKRVNTIIKSLDELKKRKLDVQKIKPDQQVFGADGTSIHEGFSKSKLEELNKANQEVKVLEDALDQALNHNKYDKLLKLIKV